MLSADLGETELGTVLEVHTATPAETQDAKLAADAQPTSVVLTDSPNAANVLLSKQEATRRAVDATPTSDDPSPDAAALRIRRMSTGSLSSWAVAAAKAAAEETGREITTESLRTAATELDKKLVFHRALTVTVKLDPRDNPSLMKTTPAARFGSEKRELNPQDKRDGPMGPMRSPLYSSFNTNLAGSFGKAYSSPPARRPSITDGSPPTSPPRSRRSSVTDIRKLNAAALPDSPPHRPPPPVLNKQTQSTSKLHRAPPTPAAAQRIRRRSTGSLSSWAVAAAKAAAEETGREITTESLRTAATELNAKLVFHRALTVTVKLDPRDNPSLMKTTPAARFGTAKRELNPQDKRDGPMGPMRSPLYSSFAKASSPPTRRPASAKGSPLASPPRSCRTPLTRTISSPSGLRRSTPVISLRDALPDGAPIGCVKP